MRVAQRLEADAWLEEPGNLEIAFDEAAGAPRHGNAFLGSIVKFEYGVKTWWTTKFYLDGQATSGQGALFTGTRTENRFRPLMGEHRINPVLYSAARILSPDSRCSAAWERGASSVWRARRTIWRRSSPGSFPRIRGWRSHRFTLSYEFEQAGRRIAQLFRGRS